MMKAPETSPGETPPRETSPGETALLPVTGDGAELGRSLRIWRALRRVKQMRAAEMLRVSQATISRWENGRLAPTRAEQVAIRQLLAARLDSAADHELARLVTGSDRPVHLICDLTHRLLALSATRARDWRGGRGELMGRSLWRYASDELRAAEAALADHGWYQPAPPAIEGVTGANHSRRLRIRPGRFRFTRFQLSDGSYARLVETLSVE
ncbi:MAG TPA: helix-turn-helix transcriptional regulator [Dongiaceae bacterium]|nr:helix-turn-helix transcriptional regulator [Dongiaceae bacterium]